MNDSLLTANRTVHLKIVMVSFAAAIMVVVVGMNARTTEVSSTEIQTNSDAVKVATPLSHQSFFADR